MDYQPDTLKKLLEANIPVDDYAKAADLIQDHEDFSYTADPAEDFKRMILILNKRECLDPSLKDYCIRYGEEYKEPEITGEIKPWNL